jgi:hypothetical protein
MSKRTAAQQMRKRTEATASTRPTVTSGRERPHAERRF